MSLDFQKSNRGLFLFLLLLFARLYLSDLYFQGLCFVFHLYVADFEAEKAFLQFEKPINTGLTLPLSCHDGQKGYGHHWKSQPVYLKSNDLDSLRYKYSVKVHQGIAGKALSLLKSMGTSTEVIKTENKYKKIFSGRKHQYDVFKLPGNDSYMDSIFAGQFYFVKMLYENIDSYGHNLKALMIECDHVGFGHPSYRLKDRQTFFEWVETSIRSHQFSPYKSAYICALFGQYFRRLEFKLSLRRELSGGMASADLLMYNLRRCPSTILTHSSLNAIKDIDLNLLEASSAFNGLEYILNFGHLFKSDVVLRVADDLRVPFNPKEFDSTATEIILRALSNFQCQGDKIEISQYIVMHAPNVDSLWTIYRLLNEGPQQQLLSDEVFVDKFKGFLNQRSKLDLLEPEMWKTMPSGLKPKIAVPFCDALMDKVMTTRTLEKSKLAELCLDKTLQDWASTGIIKLVKYLTNYRDTVALDIVHAVFESHNFNKLWEAQDENAKQDLAHDFVLNKVKSRQQEVTISKEKVVEAFKILQEAIEMRLFKNSGRLMDILGKTVIQHTQKLPLRAIVDAYEDIHKSAWKTAKDWYMKLLTCAVQTGSAKPDVRSKVIDVICSSSGEHSANIDQEFLIDGYV